MEKSARKWRLWSEKAGKQPRRKLNAEDFESIALKNIEFTASNECHYWMSIEQTFLMRLVL